MEQVRAGRANAEIAVRLGISVSTVRYHLGNILGKLELPDRAAMAAWDGEPRRVRAWAPLLWLLGRLGVVGGGAAAAAVVGAVVVVVAIIGSGGGGSDGGGASVVATAEATVEVTEPPEEPELSPAERAARVTARFWESGPTKSCFLVRYWSDESGQLVLADATVFWPGAPRDTDGCEGLLRFAANAPVTATERVPAERGVDDTPPERAGRVAIQQAVWRYVPRGFMDACAVLGDAAPIAAASPDAMTETRPPDFELTEDGCVVLPDPSLLDPPRTIMMSEMPGSPLPVEACLIQYVESRPSGQGNSDVPPGAFAIEITPGCGFVPGDAGGSS